MRALVGARDPGTELIVHELRLPRSLAGLLVGIAFGVSGALLQAMTHNPLASPDMMGITQGAGAAVVAGIVLGWDAGLSTQALGLLGALTAALLVYVLAWKRGTPHDRLSDRSGGRGRRLDLHQHHRPPHGPRPALPGPGGTWAGWSATSTAVPGSRSDRSP